MRAAILELSGQFPYWGHHKFYNIRAIIKVNSGNCSFINILLYPRRKKFMSIVYVPLGEAKLCKSDCFSDLEISEATFYIFQNGGIPVGPFWCEPKMSSANTYLLKGKSKPAKINTQPTTSSRTLRLSLTWSRESPTNPYLCKVALSTYIVFHFYINQGKRNMVR